MRPLVILALAALAACAGAPPAMRIDVPVAVPCPPPPVAVRPALPIEQINEHSTASEILRAYVATTEVLMGYAEALEKLLLGYQPDPVQSNP
jgi:hypothetical protein